MKGGNLWCGSMGTTQHQHLTGFQSLFPTFIAEQLFQVKRVSPLTWSASGVDFRPPVIVLVYAVSGICLPYT